MNFEKKTMLLKTFGFFLFEEMKENMMNAQSIDEVKCLLSHYVDNVLPNPNNVNLNLVKTKLTKFINDYLKQDFHNVMILLVTLSILFLKHYPKHHIGVSRDGFLIFRNKKTKNEEFFIYSIIKKYENNNQYRYGLCFKEAKCTIKPKLIFHQSNDSIKNLIDDDFIFYILTFNHSCLSRVIYHSS